MSFRKFSLNEDWTSTVVGFIIIILSVLVFQFFDFETQWPKFSWNKFDNLNQEIISLKNIYLILIVFILSYITLFLAHLISGQSLIIFKGYLVLFSITIVATIIGGSQFLKEWGLETVIFSLIIGLLIRNLIGVPQWLLKTLNSELYVKIGLVLLGTSIIFEKIVAYGIFGVIQSVVVVFGVWYFSFWLCGKMKIEKDMAMMLSSAVSICGVSAAVATSGAIKGDKKKLAYVVSLVLVIAVPMILIMPFLAKLIGLDPIMAGAWIGGTIDTTGAVVATGTAFGDEAVEVSSIVKFSQNVLLGIAAFLIAIYWSYTNKGENNEYADKPTLKDIWSRFPKFVLGFILASVLFSFVLSTETHSEALTFIKKFQGLFFALAFTAIGLETDFKTLINQENKKATFAFILAQIFNVIFTLIIVYIVFGWAWNYFDK